MHGATFSTFGSKCNSSAWKRLWYSAISWSNMNTTEKVQRKKSPSGLAEGYTMWNRVCSAQYAAAVFELAAVTKKKWSWMFECATKAFKLMQQTNFKSIHALNRKQKWKFCSSGLMSLDLQRLGSGDMKRKDENTHPHLIHLPSQVSPSADETLMIMAMSNDHHFTTLMPAGNHFPPCGSRALSSECSGSVEQKGETAETENVLRTEGSTVICKC